MKLAVTAMVRDEADIIRQWLDYHVAQGVDSIIVTDNGSVDGTREILQGYADKGIIDLRDDPVQQKQQGVVVTAMAREAFSVYGADWVINADADEFLMPVDRSLRLTDVFSRLDPAINSFTVPVVNMVGEVALSGAGIDRLHWRDERTNEQLQHRGVLAQPTPNAIHIGSPDVAVVQGNHLVSLSSHGAPPPELALEVLHLPWRSWRQLSNKVEISGRAYEANPDLAPSPNHHGMLDYRRYREGALLPYYALRMITESEAATGPFQRDDGLRDFFATLDVDKSGYPVDDVFSEKESHEAVQAGLVLRARDVALAEEREQNQARSAAALARVLELERHVHGLEQEQARLAEELAATRSRKVVRIADAIGERRKRIRR